MTNLRDLMHQTVEREHADMVRLASRARRQGTTMRRRRRLAAAGTSVGVVLVLAVGAAGAGTLFPGGAGSPDTTEFAGPAASSGTPGVPATAGGDASGEQHPDRPVGLASAVVPGAGRGLPFPEAGDALQAAVSEALPGGVISDVHGRRILADEHNPEAVAADLSLAPTAGAPAGGVSVFFLTGGFGGGISAEEYVNWCPDDVDFCQVSTLPDGTVVKTFSHTLVDTPTGPWTLYRVERLVDGVVIGVNAAAGRAEDKEGSVLAPNPPLTMRQLVDVAAQLQPLR